MKVIEGQERIYKIQRFSIHDGPGIRTTLFFQGCPLACIWCHNPESQKILPGGISRQQTETICSRIMEQVVKDKIYYEESGGGVTFSGGEPLMQPDLLCELGQRCRAEGIHTCLDTSGAVPAKGLIEAAGTMDMILYDLKLMDDHEHIRFTGQPLGPVLENLAILSDLDVYLKIRFPMIPGITDTTQNVNKMIDFLADNTRFKDLHILPMHRTAEGKYRQMAQTFKIRDISPPSEESVKQLAALFESKGFRIAVGG